jgi:ABC-type glycerol-3-phosphate transport system substrate-binding protein
MKRVRRTVVSLAVAGAAAVAGMTALAPAASAAPITCPDNQKPTHVNGTWFCENSGGNPTGAGHDKGTGDKI